MTKRMAATSDQTHAPAHARSSPLSMDSLISSLESTLSTSPDGIEGIDSEDDRKIGTISTLNHDYMSSRQEWYGAALAYWDDAKPTVDGMLGGFANLSPSDLAASTRFLLYLKRNIRPNLQFGASCECGAGIGRVTKGLFLPLNFARFDLVEASAELISHAPEYIDDSDSSSMAQRHTGNPGSSKCRFFCTGLEEFEPKPNTYDVVWVQWCIIYLTDLDCISFLQRMGTSLRDGGIVVIKDNTCTGNAYVLDRDDSSVTRSLDYLLALADLAGLRVVYQRMQGEDVDDAAWPDDMFPVPMIALEFVGSAESEQTDATSRRVAGGEYGEGEAIGYRDAKEVPFRERIELYSTLQLVGDATGKRVVDVACGTGWLTKALKYRARASYVLGTDLSAEMISLAKKEDPTIDYIIEDIVETARDEYDTVTSNWLLVNAHTKSQLRAMCDGLARKTKLGGRLITVVTNPALYSYGDTTFMKKYGFEFVYPEVVEEGAAILIRCYTPTGEFAVEVENYYHSRQDYIEALTEAGFSEVAFHQPKLSPNPSGVDDSEYWSSFFKCPLFLAITATLETR